jgi:hypothetical protein
MPKISEKNKVAGLYLDAGGGGAAHGMGGWNSGLM